MREMRRYTSTQQRTWPTFNHLSYEIDQLARASFEGYEHDRELVDAMQEFIVKGSQGFVDKLGDKILRVWKRHHAFIHATAEDYFVRQGVGNAPEKVARFLRLAPVLAGKQPKKEVEKRLAEATKLGRSYTDCSRRRSRCHEASWSLGLRSNCELV